MRARPSDWFILSALVVIWGSTFMFVKIALVTFPPATLVAIRLSIGSGLLLLFLLIGRHSLKHLTTRLFIYLTVMAMLGNVLPFYSISWGQQFTSSGLAGIIMATMPLMTLLLSHLFLPEDKLTKTRIAGFILGFLGILVLLGPNVLLGSNSRGVAELAIFAGALFYSVNSIIAKRRPAGDDLMISAFVLTIAAVIMMPVSVVSTDSWLNLPLRPLPLFSLIFVGVFSTALATVLYFRLIRTAGPAFLSQINYLIPVWALLMGAVFLGEQIQISDVFALTLLLAGLALANADPKNFIS